MVIYVGVCFYPCVFLGEGGGPGFRICHYICTSLSLKSEYHLHRLDVVVAVSVLVVVVVSVVRDLFHQINNNTKCLVTFFHERSQD